MIYEWRTSYVRVTRNLEYEERIVRSLPARERFGKLAGCWQTEIGPLPQVIELWAFEDFAALGEAAASDFNQGGFPPKSDDLVITATSEIFEPAPFMRPLRGEPQRLGRIYELRTYQLRQGTIKRLLDDWAPYIEGREQLSPMGGCWGSKLGALDRLRHMWPYPDLNTRLNTRTEAIDRGVWPPPPPPEGHYIVTQEITIMLPLACSPLQ